MRVKLRPLRRPKPPGGPSGTPQGRVSVVSVNNGDAARASYEREGSTPSLAGAVPPPPQRNGSRGSSSNAAALAGGAPNSGAKYAPSDRPASVLDFDGEFQGIPGRRSYGIVSLAPNRSSAATVPWEATNLAQLCRLHHPHCVAVHGGAMLPVLLAGAAAAGGPVAAPATTVQIAVEEFLPGGTLRDFITGAAGGAADRDGLFGGGLDFSANADIARGIVQGCIYLHGARAGSLLVLFVWREAEIRPGLGRAPQPALCFPYGVGASYPPLPSALTPVYS